MPVIRQRKFLIDNITDQKHLGSAQDIRNNELGDSRNKDHDNTA